MMSELGGPEGPHYILRRMFTLVAIWLIAGAARAQTGPPTNDVIVRAAVDRTAMWVADRVTYTIDITCKRGVDILVDDLSRDRLKLDGLEILENDTDRRTISGDDTAYTFRYVLTTYRTDMPTLTIAPLAVRYAVRRAGEPLVETPPAGEVQVPGAAIALRSALPDDAEVSGIRSDRPPHQRPRRFAVLPAIGIGLVIVSIGPVLFAAVAFARRSRSDVVKELPRARRSDRTTLRDERESLDAVRAIDVDTIDGRREAFTRLDAIVRDHLGRVSGLDGASLTPAEVSAASASNGAKVPAELVAAVLATCEIARYAPPSAIPTADACRDAITKVEEIIGR